MTTFNRIFLTLLLPLALAADKPADSIHLTGPGLNPSDYTPARIKSDLSANLKTVEYSSHGQSHHATCLPLLSLLQSAGLDTTLKHDPSADPSKKHLPLRLAVTVTGQDGYAVTFSLAELLPDAGNHPAYLALDTDDKPLAANEGPLKLIVPSDAKPSRWVRAVASVTLSDPTRK